MGCRAIIHMISHILNISFKHFIGYHNNIDPIHMTKNIFYFQFIVTLNKICQKVTFLKIHCLLRKNKTIRFTDTVQFNKF